MSVFSLASRLSSWLRSIGTAGAGEELPVAGVRKRRLAIHHVYYFLAAFDLFAVGIGFCLSHHANNVLARNVAANAEWARIHTEIADLRRMAGRINAPGNDVFSSRDAPGERERLEAAAAELAPGIERLRATLAVAEQAGSGTLDSMHRIATASGAMVKQTRELLDLYAAGDTDAAGAAMAGMDRSYDAAVQAIEQLSAELRVREAEAGQQSLAEASSLGRLEYVLGVVILIMVTAVAAYGHQIGRIFHRQLDELGSFNTRLEARIRERTLELEEANRDVVALNQGLARNLAELGRAKATLEQQERAIREQNELFQSALRHLPHAMVWFDASRRLLVCNELYRIMWELPAQLVEPGTPCDVIADVLDRPGMADITQAFEQAYADRRSWHRVVEAGGSLHIAVAHIPMPGGGILSTFTDVSEQRRLEEKIAHLAHHDALTGLVNRHGLRDELGRALARAERGERFALLCLDLDHFKQVNDTLGHPIGDRLLQTVAARLQASVRKTDVITRMGGDEFAIIQVLADQPEGATTLAARIIQEISAPYEIDDHRMVIGTSVGIVVAPDDGADVDTLLKNADLALYRAKADGRGVFRLYEPEMDARMQARRLLELDLRQALALDQLELFYQPLVDTETRAIKGFEALLRWRHPERGLVSPGDFIPLAEEIGLMGTIGAWALQTACLEASRWPDHLRVAVNVSPTQFRDRALELDVAAALAASGLAAHRLEVEITETVLLEDTEETIRKLGKLRDFGVRIALDDFGTGYSSLSYLRSFPFDKIKIDRSFTQSASDSGSSMAIIRAVVGLSDNLGMSTTAEGVETLQQLGMLRAEGCKEVQGYVFSRPVPASAVQGLLAASEALRDQEDPAAAA